MVRLQRDEIKWISSLILCPLFHIMYRVIR